MKFIDTVAGVGGFRLGMERAGHECVWSCEIDRWCQAVYRHHWKTVEAGDIKAVDPFTIPDFDVLCAGFPCQSFSVAGKRKGFADSRGTLFFDIARIVEAKRPPLLLLENVKGLLSHDEGRTFGRILSILDDLGYWVEWQVLDSQDFGVPQHRERVFIIGHLGKAGGREIFPIREVDRNNLQGDGKEARGEVTNTLTGGYATQNARGTYIRTRSNQPYRFSDVVPPLRQSDKAEVRIAEEKPTILQEHSFGGKDGRGRGIRMFDDGVTLALTQQMGTNGGNVPMVTTMIHQDVLRKGEYGDGLKEEQSFTLDRTCGRDFLVNAPRIRRLTPIECERLQSFPDNFTKWGIDEKGNKIELSDTQRYKMMGNAVTVNVIEFLAERLKGVA